MDGIQIVDIIQGGALGLLTFVLWRIDQTARAFMEQQGKEKADLIALVKSCMDNQDTVK